MKLKLIILAFFIGTTLFAQKDRREKIKALKIAHITEQLNLSPEQAQKFWPIYNAYESKMEAVHNTERTMMHSLKDNWESISEKEAQDGLRTILTSAQGKNNAKETLITQLKNTLSAKETLILLKAEEDFKRKLLHRLRGNRKGQEPRDRN